MELNIKKDNQTLLVALTGRLDTTTSPALERALAENIADVTELTLDLATLDYLSSAGLRVILSAQKQMIKKGKMTVKNVNSSIMEVFEITGFADILTIE